MKLINWIVTLVIVLMAIGFFCARRPAAWSCRNRARHLTGTRLLMQAACALWAALLIAANALFSIDDLGGVQLSPPEALAGVALLLACSGYWSVRGRRLLKPRRVFGGG
jgi:protein-S-isoprenylcysteine O-methyltransferase Ste14